MRPTVLRCAWFVFLLAMVPLGLSAQDGQTQWRKLPMKPSLSIEPTDIGLIVRNRDPFPYTSVRISVNKEYYYIRQNVPPGGLISLKWSRFLRPDGTAYSLASVPMKYILIETQTTDGNRSLIGLDCRK